MADNRNRDKCITEETNTLQKLEINIINEYVNKNSNTTVEDIDIAEGSFRFVSDEEFDVTSSFHTLE